MPPKAKFTREEIVNAGLSIVRKRGMGAVTARELGMELGSSARPVFTVFQSMEEVQEEIVLAAKDVYNRCVKQGLSQEMAFKSVGMEYIGFARREPQLFRLLFMRERAETPGVKDVLFAIDDNHEEILHSIQAQYGLNEEDAWALYRHLWIYTHGIAALCATNVCSFEEEEIEKMVTEIFIGVLKNIKAGERYDQSL